MDHEFPTERLNCSRCSENYMNYLGHFIFNGFMQPHWHVFCAECLTNNLEEILGKYKVKLIGYSLSFLITQIWDEDEKQLVPATRGGGFE